MIFILIMVYLVIASQLFEFPQPEKAMLAVYIGFAVVFLVGLAGKSLPTFLGVSESSQVSNKPIPVSPEPVQVSSETSEG